MQFLDAIGLAYFWEKIKDWANSCFFSNKGGEISPRKGLHYIIDGEQLDVSKSGNENETISIFNVDENRMEAIAIVKTGGTATQVLMADGSVRNLNAANGICGLDANGRIPLAQLGNLDTSLFKLVTSLPSSGESNKIYIVKDGNDANDVYQEYYYTNGAWEKIGTHTVKVDLSPYAKTADVNTALAKKVDMVSGKGLSTNDFTAAYKSKLDRLDLSNLDDNAVVLMDSILMDVKISKDTSSVSLTLVTLTGDETEVTIQAATSSLAGVMSAADKTKLNGISSFATADSAIPTSVIDALN